MREKYLFLEVTTDHLELPLAVASSVEELARLRCVTANNIHHSLKNAQKKGIKCKYIKVRIEEE